MDVTLSQPSGPIVAALAMEPDMSNENVFAIPPVNSHRLLSRFLKYVQVDTTADPSAISYPSSAGQLTLGAMLATDLLELGLTDAHQDEHGLVWATIPATDGGNSATIALIAHLDTSPESPGKNVQPQVVNNYSGNEIPLASGQVISPKETPELVDLVGKTLITSDGTTLLGGDDKAGVAILVELAACLMENPSVVHGPIRLLFTCDEEIGRGTDKIDLQKIAALVGYTLDGGGSGQLDIETFSADAATIQFAGHNIHPAIAKGRMINALRAAAFFVERLPRFEMAPECTDAREPFLHPYNLEGGVAQAKLSVLLRTFDTPELANLANRLQEIAQITEREFPGLECRVTITPQYRNLKDGLMRLPESIALAKKAFANLGRDCQETIIRGGTDGSLLTAKGLPTPNLSSGQHNIHALTEFACLEEMVAAIEHIIELSKLWSAFSQH